MSRFSILTETALTFSKLGFHTNAIDIKTHFLNFERLILTLEMQCKMVGVETSQDVLTKIKIIKYVFTAVQELSLHQACNHAELKYLGGNQCRKIPIVKRGLRGVLSSLMFDNCIDDKLCYLFPYICNSFSYLFFFFVIKTNHLKVGSVVMLAPILQ